MALRVLSWGPNTGRKVIALHGFTQASEVWETLGNALGAMGYHVLAPDLPGHGFTSWQLDQQSATEAAKTVVDTCGSGHYLGYSLGARIALRAALNYGDSVSSLLLCGLRIAPVDIAARIDADNALAKRIEMADTRQYSDFIDEWLASSVNSRLTEDSTFRSIRLRNRQGGLASSLRHRGLGQNYFTRDELALLKVRTTLAYGQYDLDGIETDAQLLKDMSPDLVRLVRMRGAGHSAPFEVPDRFLSEVLRAINAPRLGTYQTSE